MHTKRRSSTERAPVRRDTTRALNLRFCGARKLPRLDDRKSPHISNIGRLEIVQPRGFGVPQNRQFRARVVYLTLIELLIVMGMLMMILGIVGVGIGTAVQTERFRASGTLLVDKLRLAQDIMLILRTSVRVKLEQQDKGLQVTLLAEGGLTPALAAASGQPIIVVGIKDFQFTDLQGKTSTNNVTLDFLSGGGKMTSGSLLISEDKLSNASAARRQIFLSGYPSPIEIGEPSNQQIQKGGEFPEDLSQLYPREVREEELKRNEQGNQQST